VLLIARSKKNIFKLVGDLLKDPTYMQTNCAVTVVSDE